MRGNCTVGKYQPRVPAGLHSKDGEVWKRDVREFLAGVEAGVAFTYTLREMVREWYWQAEEAREQVFAAAWRGHIGCMDGMAGMCEQCLAEYEVTIAVTQTRNPMLGLEGCGE